MASVSPSVVPSEFQLCKSVGDQLCPPQFLQLFCLVTKRASFSLNCSRYGQEGFRLLGEVWILLQIFLPISSSAGLRPFPR